MGSRGAQGEVMQEGRPSSAAGGKQGVHAMAKAAALSQLVIFMRRQHLPLSTQQQISQKAPRGRWESVGPRPVSGPPGRDETRHEWSVSREWKSTGSQAGSPAGGPLLTMTALPLINTHFLIPICFSLLCNLLYQTGMGVSPTGT